MISLPPPEISDDDDADSQWPICLFTDAKSHNSILWRGEDRGKEGGKEEEEEEDVWIKALNRSAWNNFAEPHARLRPPHAAPSNSLSAIQRCGSSNSAKLEGQ